MSCQASSNKHVWFDASQDASGGLSAATALGGNRLDVERWTHRPDAMLSRATSSMGGNSKKT